MAEKRILYTCSDSPPGRAVQIVLKYLDIPYTIKTVDFDSGEHFSEYFLDVGEAFGFDK
jgi:glutathione S-transferase